MVLESKSWKIFLNSELKKIGSFVEEFTIRIASDSLFRNEGSSNGREAS